MNDIDREEPCAAAAVPESMAAHVMGYKWARDKVGQSGCAVYRLHSKNSAVLWNCLEEFEPSLQERLVAQYGIADPDRRKLQFHLLLDELF